MGNPSQIAAARARRVQWAVREELELDEPALQGLAAEPVVNLTIGDASSRLLMEIASRQQLGMLGAPMGCIYGNGVPYWVFGLITSTWCYFRRVRSQFRVQSIQDAARAVV
jgi:hypothetical protein